MPDPNTPLAAQATPPPQSPAPANVAAPVNMPEAAPAQLPSMPQGQAQYVLSGAQNAQQNPNAPQPQVPMINPALAHSAKTGLAWHALMGTHTNYVPGPNGVPVPQQVQNTPGQFFRSILSGAIMGAAAGAQGNEAGSGWSAAARGAGAAQQGLQQQEQQRAQQAQQEFQNQQEVQKEQQQQQLIQAQMANMQSETAVRQHLSDLQDKEYHDRHNAASETLLKGLTEAGGVAPVDGKLPETLTVPDLVQKYTKDPSIRQAPSGYVRHFIDTTDSSELTFNGENWVHPDGTPANMTDHSTIQVLDVPMNAMTTKRPMSGSDLNKIAGQQLFKPDQTYQVAPIDMDNMNTNRLKNENEHARTQAALRQAAAGERSNQLEAERQRHAEFDAHRTALLAKKESLQTQLKELNNDLSATPADKQALQDQIAAQDQAIQDLADEEYPKTGKGTKKTAPPPSAFAQKVTTVLQKIPGVNPAVVSRVAAMSPDELASFLPSAKIPDDIKAELYAAAGKTPPPPVRTSSPYPQGYTMQNLGQDVAAGARRFLGTAPAVSSTGAPIQ